MKINFKITFHCSVKVKGSTFNSVSVSVSGRALVAVNTGNGEKSGFRRSY